MNLDDNLINFIVLALAFLVLFGLGELAYHVFQVKGEATRKFIHVGTGLLTLSFPIFFTSVIWVLLLCLSFLLILLLSQRFGFLKSINDIDRKSHGSALYPIVVILIFAFYDVYQDTVNACFILGSVTYFYLPILIMAISDPIAAIVGKSFPWGAYSIRKQQKTVSGSIAFLFSAVLIGFFFLNMSCWWLVLLIASSSAVVEGLSKNGFDNFSIPLAVALNLILFA